jgi:hypothetical protein
VNFDDRAESCTPDLAWLHQKKVPVWAALLLLVLVIGMTARWQLALSAADERVTLVRQELARQNEAEKAALAAANRAEVMRHSEEAYRLFGGALAWAVRSALARNDMDEIDRYFTMLVKSDLIDLALLTDAHGKIIVSTDRHFYAARFDRDFPAAFLREKSAAVHRSDHRNTLVVPIEGPRSRLGTALVVYTPPGL